MDPQSPLYREALKYHREPVPGKLGVVPLKSTRTQWDLSLAYSPGVAAPVLEIDRDPDLAYEYTNKANLVAVVSNGSAILGLGNRGALASKPVMEGKGVLFKRFGDIDVYDLEVNTDDPDVFIQVVRALEPTFGGINLEDIKAPECFYIEEKLIELMDIPVFHDDQHGTAIIAGAGLINALELQNKRAEDVKVVIVGAGAAGIAIAKFLLLVGVKKEHIFLLDSKGVIHTGRENLNPYKAQFAQDTDARTLEDALAGADVFIGVAVANLLTEAMLRSMADRPIIFALANPDPEVPYDVARRIRPDAIVATGRSDYPNQVNNVLGFPYIFRGALDVRARKINDAMKIAAAKALAALAREDVPDSVLRAYNLDYLAFGPEYILPKPLDPRVLLWEAPAVAQAAMETGVARRKLDLDRYREELENRLGKVWEVRRFFIQTAHRAPSHRVVFAEGEEVSILRAAHALMHQNIARPIVLGRTEVIRERMTELGLEEGIEIVEPEKDPRLEPYAQSLFARRSRKGITLEEARRILRLPNYFGAMMVAEGDADAFLTGITYHYPDAVRPILRVIGKAPEVRRVVGVYVVIHEGEVFLFADTTMTIHPTPEDLVDITVQTAMFARSMGITPRVALLSFSNFGSVDAEEPRRIQEAVRILHERYPDLEVDGEVQADVALSTGRLQEVYPFSRLKHRANVLIFPCLAAANIAYKLLARLSNADLIGPILLGTARPAHALQRGDSVDQIITMATVALSQAVFERKGGGPGA